MTTETIRGVRSVDILGPLPVWLDQDHCDGRRRALIETVLCGGNLDEEIVKAEAHLEALLAQSWQGLPGDDPFFGALSDAQDDLRWLMEPKV